MHVNKSLIQACIKQDRTSQVLLYRACYVSFMQICMRYKRDENEAASLLNEGMLKVISNLDKYDSSTPFEYWARRVMINTAIDDFRKIKRHRNRNTYKLDEELEIIDFRKDENEALQNLHTEELWKIINLLPEGRLQIFNLIAIDGYTYRETAEKLEMNENTCKWHVFEARKFLKAELKKTLMYTTIHKDEKV